MDSCEASKILTTLFPNIAFDKDDLFMNHD